MRVYLGTFGEEEVQRILQELRGAKIRVETKPSLNIRLRGRYFIKGKMDEIKKKYGESELKDMFQKWENYIEYVRDILKEGMEEMDFEKKLILKLMPDYDKEMVEKFFEVIKENKSERIEEFERMVIGMEAEKMKDFLDRFGDAIKIVEGINEMLKLNGVKYEEGKIYGVLPDNPTLMLYVEGIDDKKAEELGIEYTFDTYIDRQIDVYANLADIFYESEKLKNLAVKNPEYIELAVLSDVISMIIEKIEGRMEMDEFFGKIMKIEEDNHKVFLSPSAAEEIVEMLEKMEVLKVKKGRIWLNERKKT